MYALNVVSNDKIFILFFEISLEKPVSLTTPDRCKLTKAADFG
jgi:hypothetical protein